MPGTPSPDRPLPRGRHDLPREAVVASQRRRLLRAMATVMARRGYASTSVAAIVAEAGVSRQTFYELYASKEEAFVATFDAAAGLALERMRHAAGADLSPPERVRRALSAYIDAVMTEPDVARVLLIEVHAAGPEAMARRAVLQRRFAALVADVLEVRDDQGRFACAILVAGAGAMVATHLASGELEALPRLASELEDLLHALVTGDARLRLD